MQNAVGHIGHSNRIFKFTFDLHSTRMKITFFVAYVTPTLLPPQALKRPKVFYPFSVVSQLEQRVLLRTTRLHLEGGQTPGTHIHHRSRPLERQDQQNLLYHWPKGTDFLEKAKSKIVYFYLALMFFPFPLSLSLFSSRHFLIKDVCFL